MRDSPIYAFVQPRTDGFAGWKVPSCPFCGFAHHHGEGLSGRRPHCGSGELKKPKRGYLGRKAPKFDAGYVLTTERQRQGQAVGFVCRTCSTWYASDSEDGYCGDQSQGQSVPCPGRLRFNDPEYAAESDGMVLDDAPIRTVRKEVDMIRGEVRLHREGEQFAVSTNAETERDFLDGVASALAGQDCEANELSKWLPLIVDVACKMRGYKSDVTEKRIIIAGAWLPNDHAAIVGTAKVEKEVVTA